MEGLVEDQPAEAVAGPGRTPGDARPQYRVAPEKRPTGASETYPRTARRFFPPPGAADEVGAGTSIAQCPPPVDGERGFRRPSAAGPHPVPGSVGSIVNRGQGRERATRSPPRQEGDGCSRSPAGEQLRRRMSWT